MLKFHWLPFPSVCSKCMTEVVLILRLGDRKRIVILCFGKLNYTSALELLPSSNCIIAKAS